MRMSCNGCRVLRKGCSEDCSIRPCLQWIKNPDSQAHATVFLAKFYGRAGLMNLINAGPEHLRPAIFRSLLYEACGRIVNPIYGSVGLLWSGSWQLCQAAVENVLKGAPIVSIPIESATNPALLKAYDIRHVSKDDHAAAELHKIKNRNRFKRAGKSKSREVDSAVKVAAAEAETISDSGGACNIHWGGSGSEGENNHVSSLSSSHSEPAHAGDGEADSMLSNETVEASLMSNRAKPSSLSEENASTSDEEDDREANVELELTLGFEPVSTHGSCRRQQVVKVNSGLSAGLELGLSA